MNNYNNFEKEIPGWTAFIENCKKRAKDDEKKLMNQEFSKEIKRIECELMRSPEICPKPSYLLVAMEPKIENYSLPTEEICYFPLFLRYCIYKYLCNEKFDFYITDLAKGSMLLQFKEEINDNTKESRTRKIQNFRYQWWLDLFKEEWQLLGKPKIIAIGTVVYNKLQRAKIDCEYVEHYSKQVNFSKLLEDYHIDYQPNETAILKEIKDFWVKFGNHLYHERHKQPDNDINFPLGEGSYKPHNMKVIAVYRYYFEEFLRTGKIPHKHNAIPRNIKISQDVNAVTSDEFNERDERNKLVVGKFTDKRDGKVYRTVKIGEQIWMAENLAFAAKGCPCYKREYGMLYDWDTAMDEKTCPVGWHLPSYDEWQTLVDFVGGKEIAGKMVKSKNGWKDFEGKSGNGTDAYGFSALPSSFVSPSKEFKKNDGRDCRWWSSEYGKVFGLVFHNQKSRWLSDVKGFLCSIRCIQD